MFPILIILIFVRPFISSLAFPCLNTIYVSIMLIFLAAWVILKGLSFKEIKSIKYPLLFFISALAISIIFSQDKLNSLSELYKYVTVILLFFMIAPLSKHEKNNIINAIILSAIVISALAIYQYFFGFKHLLNFVAKEKISSHFVLDYLYQRRVFFPFVTPNILAGYLILVIPLVLIVPGLKRWFFLLLLSSALFLTKSVGALLSLFLAASLYLFLRKEISFGKLTLLITAEIGVILVFVLRQAGISNHVIPIFSIARRLDYWKAALEIIKMHPLVGVGIGNFNLYSSRYAHNSYLQIWAEMGISGILSFIWLLFSLFKLCFKNIFGTTHGNKLFAKIIIANIGFLLHNFIDFTFFMPEVSMFFWITFGILIQSL